MKKKAESKILCNDCVHEFACKMWTSGRVIASENCPNHETVKESASYYCGFLDGQKSNTNQYVIDRLMDLVSSLKGEEK